ncbi:hypothetical protein ACEPAG_3650 [Sanghuangporus baumii]
MLFLVEAAEAVQAEMATPAQAIEHEIAAPAQAIKHEIAAPAQAINHEIPAPAQFACGICDYIGHTAYALRVHKNLQ